MTLTILSKDSKSKVLSAIGQITKNHPATELQVLTGLDQLHLITSSTRAILSLGPQILEQFQMMGVVPKGRTVTGLRKTTFLFKTIPTLFSYNVGIAEVDYGYYVDLLTDVQLAYRLEHTGTTHPITGKYEYVQDLSKVVQEVVTLLQTQEHVDLAMDTETLGLDRFHPEGYLVSLQWSCKPGTARVLYFPNKAESLRFLLKLENQEHLHWLLNEPRIRLVGANAKYDTEWIYEQTGIGCTNLRFDTTLVGSLLDENRSNGLDVHAKIYTDGMGGYSDEFDKNADKSRMDLEYLKSPEKFLAYSGGDPDATLQVKHAQRLELLEDQQLTGFYVNILHPAARAFEHVERTGCLVDSQAYAELNSELKVDLNLQVNRVKQLIGGILAVKHHDPKVEGGLNLTKASLITDFMFTPRGLNLKPLMVTEKSKSPSTAMEHLLMFKDHPEAQEFVQALSEYSSTNKTRNTYVTGFLKHLRPDTRFHPSYWFFAGNKDEGEGGTNTGRLSAKDPAWQTLPKHTKWAKPLRRCMIAPPGYVIGEFDYSQGELKVMACLANEQEMISAYLNDMDLHVLTSGTVLGYTYEEMLALQVTDPEKFESVRQLGKAGNFGLIYGMGVDGFVEYARTTFGVKLTKDQAADFRTGFFNTYSGLVTYHQTYKAYAKKHGFVRSPLGRVRHLPLINSPHNEVRSKAERQAINSPVQGALSDMTIWSIAEHKRALRHIQAPCFGAVHDAGYYYLPEDQAEQLAKIIVETMSNLPFDLVGWKPQLQFTADAKIGPNMADLKKLKFNISEPYKGPAQLIAQTA